MEKTPDKDINLNAILKDQIKEQEAQDEKEYENENSLDEKETAIFKKRFKAEIDKMADIDSYKTICENVYKIIDTGIDKKQYIEKIYKEMESKNSRVKRIIRELRWLIRQPAYNIIKQSRADDIIKYLVKKIANPRVKDSNAQNYILKLYYLITVYEDFIDDEHKRNIREEPDKF